MLGEEGVVEIESHWAATRRENQGVSDVWRGRLCAYITILIVIYAHRRPLHTSETPWFSRLVAAQCDSISTTPSSPSMSQRQRTGVSALHNPPPYNPNGLAPIRVFYLGRVSCLRGAS